MAMAPVIIGLRNDTGTPGDGITADPNPMLYGTAAAGTLVRLMLGAIQIGSATADAQGNWEALANIIDERSVFLVARGTDGDSAAFCLAVDQTGPTAPVLTGFAGDTSGDRSQPIWQTTDITPAVAGTAEAGAIIRAYDGTRLLTTTTADGSGAWQLALGTLPLGQYYAIGIDAEDGAGNVSARATLNLRVGETTLPVVTAVAGPTADNYEAGQALDFTVQFNKPVVVAIPPGGAGPLLEVLVGDQVLTAAYVSSPVPHRLTFRLTLPANASDQDGITLGEILQAGGTIKDNSNNLLAGGLMGVPDLSGVLVKADLDPPSLTGITGPAPGNHRAGDTLVFTLAFDETVQLQLGAPSPVLEVVIGGTIWQAALLGHPAANKLSFGLVVEADAKAQAGITLGRLIGGGAVTDKVGNAWPGALGTVPDFSNVLVQADFTPPAIRAAVLERPGPVGIGDSLVIDLQMSEAVAVAGGKAAPVLNLQIGGQAMQATLLAGADPTVLRFGLALPGGVQGHGVTLTGLNDPAGAVTDLAGNALVPTLPAAPGLANLLVDTVAPTASLVAPDDGRYIPGQVLRFTLSASEALHLADGQAMPSLLVDAGGTARHALLDPFRSSPTSLVFTLRVQPGDLAREGIRVTALEDPDGRLQDAAGNPLHLTLPGTVLGASIWPADQAAPSFHHMDGAVRGGSVDLTLVFSEAVQIVGGAPVLDLMVDGTPMQAALSAGVDGPRLLFHLDLPEGAPPQAILLAGLDLGGGQLTDLSGNAWGGGFPLRLVSCPRASRTSQPLKTKARGPVERSKGFRDGGAGLVSADARKRRPLRGRRPAPARPIRPRRAGCRRLPRLARLSRPRRARPGGAQPCSAAPCRQPLHPALHPRLPNRFRPCRIWGGTAAWRWAGRCLRRRHQPDRGLRGLRGGGGGTALLHRDPGQSCPVPIEAAGARLALPHPARRRVTAGLGRASAPRCPRHSLAAGRSLPAPPAPGIRPALAPQHRLRRRADAGGRGAARPAGADRARCRRPLVAWRTARPPRRAGRPGHGCRHLAHRPAAPGQGATAKLAARPHHRSRRARHRRALDRAGGEGVLLRTRRPRLACRRRPRRHPGNGADGNGPCRRPG